MSILGKIFTWWDGATVGTLLNSWKNGEKVGEDSLGNRYYRARKGNRRWVIYNGSNDASRVPPELARLAARHARRPAVGGAARAAPVAGRADAEPDRQPRRLSPGGRARARRPPRRRDRRL